MKDPIDLDSPLGISKREWTKVLGVNLAILLIAYAIALIFTLCGSDLFLLRFYNERLNEIEVFLRKYDIFWIITAFTVAAEETIICSYVTRKKPSVIFFGCYLAFMLLLCTVLYFTTHVIPSYTTLLCGLSVCVIYSGVSVLRKKDKKYALICLARLMIATAVSFALNGAINAFRTRCFDLWHVYSSSFYIALSIEYDLALALAFGFLTLALPLEKGGNERWTCPDTGGSSLTSTKWSKRNSPKKINLTPKQRRRVFFLKAKVIAIQTVALVIIAFVPIFSGRGIEFALMYVGFCVTRMILGFKHSLHFKSELSCVTIGALSFWGLTFLAPSAEVSIVISLVYGCAMALGFRLYWELHDMMMYHKAAKTDRYAMLYVVFKGNVDPKHINGVMRAKGYTNETYDIKIVQMYMQREKVDYIAEWTASTTAPPSTPPRSMRTRPPSAKKSSMLSLRTKPNVRPPASMSWNVKSPSKAWFATRSL